MCNTSAASLEFPSALFSNEWKVSANAEDKTRSVMLAPYGDWPNTQGLQRFAREDAQNIVNEFNKVLNTPQRVLGLPWYIGHPDHPAFNSRYKDGKAYGRIKSLEAKDDGLWANVKFNGEGENLIVNEAFHGHSTNWFLKEDPNAKGVWRPFKLKSVGFTNEPNIPVPTVTTANEAQTETLFKRLAGRRLFANDHMTEHEADKNTAKARDAGAATLPVIIERRYKRLANARKNNKLPPFVKSQ